MNKILLLTFITAFTPNAKMVVFKSIDSANDDQNKNMPLIITAAKTENKDVPMAFLISGDGGWFNFEQSIADKLSGMGIPTIGLDSRKYFWNRKTPEETTLDVIKALNKYSREWGKERFILIGYSLGSELVPFIVNRLPVEMKSKMVSEVLLSPETNTDFEIHFSNMLGMGNPQNTYNVINEIRKTGEVNTLIIFGAGEKTEVPELLKETSVKVSIIPGDHHYKFDVPLIIKTMRDNKAF